VFVVVIGLMILQHPGCRVKRPEGGFMLSTFPSIITHHYIKMGLISSSLIWALTVVFFSGNWWQVVWQSQGWQLW